jgi:hypothetical protein
MGASKSKSAKGGKGDLKKRVDNKPVTDPKKEVGGPKKVERKVNKIRKPSWSLRMPWPAGVRKRLIRT